MLQIIDITWKYNNDLKEQTINLNRYSQTLKLLDEESHEVKEIQLEGYRFNFKLSNEKICIGYKSEGKYYHCPLRTKVEGTHTQCFHCEKQEGFKAAFIFGQKPNENASKYLSQKHFIYLAWFAPNLIKVGTSSESRQYVRPIEQDALVYTFIAEADGFNIQKLERTISNEFSITENVRSNHKLKYLDYRSKDNSSIQLLEDTAKKIFARFSKSADFSDWMFKDWERSRIIDLRDLPNLFYPESEVNFIELEEHELNLVGSFKGLRGRYTLFENSGSIFAVDEREILGRRIASYIDKYVYKVEGNQQLSLI